MPETQESLYVRDRDGVVEGPFDADEFIRIHSTGKFSDEAQVNFSGEWEPMAPVAEAIIHHMTQTHGMRFLQDELQRETQMPRRQGLTIFDVAVIGGLWWWFFKVEWPAIAGAAIAFSAWTLGQVFAVVGQGALKLIGLCLQGFGGVVGIPAVLWLVWTLISKLF